MFRGCLLVSLVIAASCQGFDLGSLFNNGASSNNFVEQFFSSPPSTQPPPSIPTAPFNLLPLDSTLVSQPAVINPSPFDSTLVSQPGTINPLPLDFDIVNQPAIINPIPNTNTQPTFFPPLITPFNLLPPPVNPDPNNLVQDSQFPNLFTDSTTGIGVFVPSPRPTNPQPSQFFIDSTYLFEVTAPGNPPIFATISNNGATITYNDQCTNFQRLLTENGNQVTFDQNNLSDFGLPSSLTCTQSQAFTQALLNTATFSVQGLTIFLRAANGNLLATLERLTDANAEFRAQILMREESFLPGQRTVVLADGRTAQAEFTGGRWNIVGCTGFSGSFTLDPRNGRVSFAFPDLPLNTCAGARDFISAFQSVAFFRLNDQNGNVQRLNEAQNNILVTVRPPILMGNLIGSIAF